MSDLLQFHRPQLQTELDSEKRFPSVCPPTTITQQTTVFRVKTNRLCCLCHSQARCQRGSRYGQSVCEKTVDGLNSSSNQNFDCKPDICGIRLLLTTQVDPWALETPKLMKSNICLTMPRCKIGPWLIPRIHYVQETESTGDGADTVRGSISIK